MFKNVLRACVAGLLVVSLAQGAALEQRIVEGNVSVESAFCTKLTQNIGAVSELIYCLSGEQKSWEEIQEKAEDMPAFIAKISGMPVKQDEVLVTLRICDLEEEPLEAWHNGYSKQFNDQPSTWRPSRMWPYSWFAHAKEGEQVKIPMMNGTLLAVLNCVAFPRNAAWTFKRCVERAVGHYLADAHMGEEAKAELESLNKQRKMWGIWLELAIESRCQTDMKAMMVYKEQEKKMDEKIETIKQEHASRLLKEHYGVEMQDAKETNA